MFVDIIFGVTKSIKVGRSLRSRTAWWGYVRKMGTLVIVLVAYVIDLIYALNGILTGATVAFYALVEIVSIFENAEEIGMKVPKFISQRIKDNK